jgi:hypothetical protein
MATLEQLSAALVKADAAGNAEDAKALADAIRGMRAQSPKVDDAIDAGAKNFANESGTAMRFLQGAGKAVHDVGQGLGQMVGLTSRADVEESRRIDAPLMKTGVAANAGNIVGNLGMMAPVALAGGLTVPAAAAVGVGTGLAQPSTSTGETLTNMALGGVGGAVGQKAGNMLAEAATNRAAKITALNVANTPKLAAAREASAMGYVIPPDDLNANMLTKTLSGLSGKIKTAQEASARNQTVTNNAAKAAIGLAKDDVLDAAALKAVRDKAGLAYKAVADLPEIAPAQASTLTNSRAVEAFKPKQALQELKQARNDATAWYAAYARSASPDDLTKAKGFASTAKELESKFEDYATQLGRDDLLPALREARKLIAKTYTIEKGLNEVTGDVSASVLAKQLAKGKPLEGDLRDVARFGAAFPKASQALKESPKATSPLDWGAALAASAGTSSPLPMLMVGARPLAREAVLSGMAQRAAMKDIGPGMVGTVAQNKLARLLAAPVGVQGGLAASELTR